MRIQLQESDAPVDERVLTINLTREKIRLLHKCQRKIRLSLIDPDNYKIYTAASHQLMREINALCHEVGL